MKVPTYHERIQLVLRYIDTHRHERPSLDTLAAVACFSPHHFHRIFVALTGEGVAAYTRRIALQEAAGKLLYSQYPVTEIALDADYDSLEAFSRAFKARYGVSPTNYRRQGASSPPLRIGHMMEIIPRQKQEVTKVHVEIKTFPLTLSAAMRVTGPYDECGPVWGKLCAELGRRGLLGPHTLAIGICHDDPDVTPADKLRMECCLTLPSGLAEDSPELQELTGATDIYLRPVGGGECASTLVEGPYTLLHPAYRSLFCHWLPQSGREPDNAPSFEIYYNNPQECAPQDLKTEIFIPLKPL